MLLLTFNLNDKNIWRWLSFENILSISSDLTNKMANKIVHSIQGAYLFICIPAAMLLLFLSVESFFLWWQVCLWVLKDFNGKCKRFSKTINASTHRMGSVAYEYVLVIMLCCIVKNKITQSKYYAITFYHDHRVFVLCTFLWIAIWFSWMFFLDYNKWDFYSSLSLGLKRIKVLFHSFFV